jgi:hypothetical protein
LPWDAALSASAGGRGVGVGFMSWVTANGAKDYLTAVVTAFVRWLPWDGSEGALEEGVVDDVALVVFAFDDPVAGKGFALAGVGKDDGRLLALRGIDEKRSAGPKGVHKVS